MTLQLQVGKSYKRRDGGREDISGPYGVKFFARSGNVYHGNGKAFYGDVDKYAQQDLIAEWVDEPALPVKTLRDEFAMAALTGFITNPRDYDRLVSDGACAIACYEIADAMLKAREVQS